MPKSRTPPKSTAPTQDDFTPLDERIVKAMSHPIRFRALTILSQKTASPKMIADEIGESIGVVAYHVRILLDSGALELVDTAQRRGATEHYYRATIRPWFSDEDYSRLPASTRRALFVPTIRRIVTDALTSLDNGGFDDPSAHASYVTLTLDAKGHDDVVNLLAGTLDKLVAIQAAAINRLAKSGDEPFADAQASLLHHRVTQTASAQAPSGRRNTPATALKLGSPGSRIPSHRMRSPT